MLTPGQPSRSGPRARIFCAVPTYTGELHHRFVESYVAAVVYCLVHKIELELRIVAGASLIQYARNQLIREFLEDPTNTHLMWIDADVGFDPRAIVQLHGRNKDVVGGVYPMKCMPIEWPYEPMPGEQTAVMHRAKILPGGFMLCSRKAVQAVADAAPMYWHYMQGMRFPTKHVMDLTLEDKTLLGEDVILCRKFQQAGFDVWCDPEIAFAHCGKFEWRGILSKAIAQGPGQSRISPHLIQDLKNETEPQRLGEIIFEAFKEWGNSWSAPPGELLALATLARKSTCILETGSGLSTIVMACANPNASIHCLESDPKWCEMLREEIQRHQLTNVTIHLTPLSPENFFYVIPGDLPDWFDLAFHDGPVWLDKTHLAKSTDTRVPFYTLLEKRLRDATIVIDDVEHYEAEAAMFRHEIVGGRFAICLPNKAKAAAA